MKFESLEISGGGVPEADEALEADLAHEPTAEEKIEAEKKYWTDKMDNAKNIDELLGFIGEIPTISGTQTFSGKEWAGYAHTAYVKEVYPHNDLQNYIPLKKISQITRTYRIRQNLERIIDQDYMAIHYRPREKK